MSYVFELDPELTDVFVDNLGTSIVEFALGFDVDEEEIVLFSVTLGPSMVKWTPELGPGIGEVKV